MLVIKVMMIRLINVKNPWKKGSKELKNKFKIKKDMKVIFQALLERFISFIYCKNRNSQNLPSILESILSTSLISKNFS